MQYVITMHRWHNPSESRAFQARASAWICSGQLASQHLTVPGLVVWRSIETAISPMWTVCSARVTLWMHCVDTNTRILVHYERFTPTVVANGSESSRHIVAKITFAKRLRARTLNLRTAKPSTSSE